MDQWEALFFSARRMLYFTYIVRYKLSIIVYKGIYVFWQIVILVKKSGIIQKMKKRKLLFYPT